MALKLLVIWNYSKEILISWPVCCEGCDQGRPGCSGLNCRSHSGGYFFFTYFSGFHQTYRQQVQENLVTLQLADGQLGGGHLIGHHRTHDPGAVFLKMSAIDTAVCPPQEKIFGSWRWAYIHQVGDNPRV